MEKKKVAIVSLVALLTLSVLTNVYLFLQLNQSQLNQPRLRHNLKSNGLGFTHNGLWAELVEGVIVNDGTRTAIDVRVTVSWYAKTALIDKATIQVGEVKNGTYREVWEIHYLERKPDVHKIELNWM